MNMTSARMKKGLGLMVTVILFMVVATNALRFGNTADAIPCDRSAGQTMPSFTARTIDGRSVRFPDDYRGKVVLLDFWATWCPACRAEMPNLVSAYAAYRERGVEFLGISLDKPSGVSTSEVQSFTEQAKMTWPQVYEEGATLAEAYGVRGVPAGFLVCGNTQKLLARHDELRGAAIRKTLDRFLTKQP
jgi:peroxiredoxin